MQIVSLLFLIYFLDFERKPNCCVWNSLIAMQMTLHGKQTHSQKRSENNTSASYHTYTRKANEKNDQRVARHPHTHTIILMTATVHSKNRTFTDKQICVYFCIVWAINLSGRRASEAITLLREETMKIVHTYTLTDALIKHGSKKLKKVKRNERHHSLDSCIQQLH